MMKNEDLGTVIMLSSFLSVLASWSSFGVEPNSISLLSIIVFLILISAAVGISFVVGQIFKNKNDIKYSIQPSIVKCSICEGNVKSESQTTALSRPATKKETRPNKGLKKPDLESEYKDGQIAHRRRSFI